MDNSGSTRIVVVPMPDRLDTLTSELFADQPLLLALIDKGARKMVCDFSATTYVSSAGLRVLLTAAKRLKGLQGTFALCALCPQVLQVVKMTGLDAVFAIYPDRATAEAALQ